MAEAILRRKGVMNTKGLLPSFIYTGTHSLVDENKHNLVRHWNLTMSSDGKFTANRDMLVDLFVIAGGGAGNKSGFGGGGGFHKTINGLRLKRGSTYQIDIGNGGLVSGANGESSTAFVCTVNGGSGGSSGSTVYETWTVCGINGTASNVYFYERDGDGVEGESEGNGYMQVNLAYPVEEVTITDGRGNYFNVYRAYSVSSDGSGYPSGYYLCTLVSQDYVHTTGVTGGGGSSTYIFDTSTQVGGAGANSGAANASYSGQGGDGYGSSGGSSFGKGGNGLVVIRSTRHNFLDTVGFKTNTRYSTSNKADISHSGWDITGYIPVSRGDVVRLDRVMWYPTTENEHRGGIYFYNSSNTYVTHSEFTSALSSEWSAIYDSNGNIIQFTVPTTWSSSIAYLRIVCQAITPSSMITVNTPFIVNVLDGVGYQDDRRYSMTNSQELSETGWDLTGYFKASAGSVIRLRNVTWYPTWDNNGRGAIYWFDSSKNKINSQQVTTQNELSSWSPVYDSNGNIIQFTVPSSVPSTATYFRICCQDLTQASVITVNQEI